MSTRRSFIKSSAAFTAVALAGVGPARSETKNTTTIKARYWHPETGGEVSCELCPRYCIIQEGATSTCRVFQNRGGTLFSNGYANPCAVNIDPIEKKPLYHMLPGSRAFSIAVAGCTFRCKNCQNYTISQANPLTTQNEYLPPAEVVARAKSSGCTSIAYTYSEPTVWFEYMYDTAKLARSAGLKNIWITCGYINQAPLLDLCEYMDAANIDLKSFDDATYIKLNSGRLQPVLDTIKTAIEHGVWVELGTLLVPQWSDSPAMVGRMASWIKNSFGPQVPLHLLRFFPLYELANLYPTPDETLKLAEKAAHDAGLSHVYCGNAPGLNNDTFCPSCHKKIIGRNGFIITEMKVKNGMCGFCGEKISGLWS